MSIGKAEAEALKELAENLTGDSGYYLLSLLSTFEVEEGKDEKWEKENREFMKKHGSPRIW